MKKMLLEKIQIIKDASDEFCSEIGNCDECPFDNGNTECKMYKIDTLILKYIKDNE